MCENVPADLCGFGEILSRRSGVPSQRTCSSRELRPGLQPASVVFLSGRCTCGTSRQRLGRGTGRARMVSFRTFYQRVVAHWRAMVLLLILARVAFLIVSSDDVSFELNLFALLLI